MVNVVKGETLAAPLADWLVKQPPQPGLDEFAIRQSREQTNPESEERFVLSVRN